MPEKKKSKSKPKSYTFAIGRRKTATARVRLYNKSHIPDTKSQLVVNGIPAETYFPGEVNKSLYLKPFALTGTLNTHSASVKVSGSGPSSQLDALVHGVSRALSELDRESYRGTLKKAGLLTRDPRAKERRKVGTGGRARRRKQSPKR